MASTTASTSAAVEVCPNEKRNEPRARSSGTPIARSTWLGWGTPAEQAEPVEHSMPRASSSRSNASPSQPENEKWALPGRRCAAQVAVTTENDIGYDVADARHEVVAQPGQLLGALRLPLDGQLGRRREADDGGRIEGAGADVALLPAAVQHRRQGRGSRLSTQRPDAHRPADLVTRDRHRVETAAREVERQLAERLHGVGVERHAVLGGRPRRAR